MPHDMKKLRATDKRHKRVAAIRPNEKPRVLRARGGPVDASPENLLRKRKRRNKILQGREHFQDAFYVAVISDKTGILRAPWAGTQANYRSSIAVRHGKAAFLGHCGKCRKLLLSGRGNLPGSHFIPSK